MVQTNFQTSSDRIVIVGNPGSEHVGNHLLRAAQELGISAKLIDVRLSNGGSYFARQFNWRVRGHRPSRLDAFSNEVIHIVSAYRPNSVIVTGISPPNATVIRTIVENGIRCINFLTDDPWNPSHRAPWFFEVLPYYTTIYSPRRANISDLQRLGCSVAYLPFAYSTFSHFPETAPPEVSDTYRCDVLFYGGADNDRLPYIEALLDNGFDVHLYGGYWDKYRRTRPVWRGMADAQRLRWAVSSAKVTLCLVRHSNRDGHVMRTFEAAAMGACMLAEDTRDHREILGEDDTDHLFFDNAHSLLVKAESLIEDRVRREALAENVSNRVRMQKNTYTDRLRTMLDL